MSNFLQKLPGMRTLLKDQNSKFYISKMVNWLGLKINQQYGAAMTIVMSRRALP